MAESEHVELYHKKIVIARKQHTCCECDINIEVGAGYNRHSYLADGTFESFAVCSACDLLRAEIGGGDWECTPPLTLLWEWVSEEQFEDENNRPKWMSEVDWQHQQSLYHGMKLRKERSVAATL